MHRIHIGAMCLLMVLILGVSLEATGQDTDAGEQKIEDMSVPMGVIVLKPDESVEQKKSSVAFNHPQHFIFRRRTFFFLEFSPLFRRHVCPIVASFRNVCPISRMCPI